MPVGLDGAYGVVGWDAVVGPFGWMPVDAVEWRGLLGSSAVCGLFGWLPGGLVGWLHQSVSWLLIDLIKIMQRLPFFFVAQLICLSNFFQFNQ